MKKLLCLFLAVMLKSVSANGFDLKQEFSEGFYGLHLISAHDTEKDINNGNLGFYLRTKSGFTAGQYKNSCNTYTNYYGWSSPEYWRIRVTPLIASGYHCLTESSTQDGRRWNFTIVPTIRLYTINDVLGLKDLSFRALLVPGLAHLMVEGSFN